MNIEESIKLLKLNDEPVPKPLRLPTAAEVAKYEEQIGFDFPPEFVTLQLLAGNVTVGTLEPVVCIEGIDAYINPSEVSSDGYEMGVPRDFLPFCCDNGCYYCINSDGIVKFWDNEDCAFSNESWSLPGWISEVWVGSAV